MLFLHKYVMLELCQGFVLAPTLTVLVLAVQHSAPVAQTERWRILESAKMEVDEKLTEPKV